MDVIFEPWPWYVSGPLMALVLFLLTMMGKNFGMSSNLRTLCALCGAGKNVVFFKFDWKAQRWNLIVLLGTIIGGFVGRYLLSENTAVGIKPCSAEELKNMGFMDAGAAYLPEKLFGAYILGDIKPMALLVIGGFLVGFGARYAGGCTSGHAISGLSNLQLPSLIAVIGFFLGGLFMVHALFPLIF